MAELVILELNDNAIERVDDGAFNGLLSLHSLDLKGNVIKTLPHNTLHVLGKLTHHLFLQENRLESVD
jgi:hypothetical protein